MAQRHAAPITALLALSAIVLCFPVPAAQAADAHTLPAAPAGVSIVQNVTYLSPERKEKLDLYLPAARPAGTLSPGIVIIHGGGWTGGSKAAGREFEIGTTLAKAGYVCASIEYRLTQHNRWPTNVFDCKNAVRFLRKNAAQYGVDTRHIGVIGGSAGGHLALMVGYTSGIAELEPPSPYPGISDRVQAVVDLYGITDIRTRKNIAADGTPGEIAPLSNAVFGDKANVTDTDRALASPVDHMTSDLPPTLIAHGTSDTTVDRDQSLTLDKLLTAQKADHQLIIEKGAGHSFDLERGNGKRLLIDLRPIVIAFFNRCLKPPTSQANAGLSR